MLFKGTEWKFGLVKKKKKRREEKKGKREREKKEKDIPPTSRFRHYRSPCRVSLPFL